MNDLFKFDLSTVDSSIKQLTKEEFVNNIIPILENILKERFPDNISKQKIRVFKDRISFAAPCCGDSSYRNSLKRGNIILEGKFMGYYKCFNCGKFMRLDKFLHEYNKDCTLDIINYINSNDINFNAEKNNDSITNKLFDIEKIESVCVDKNVLINKLNLQLIDSNNKNKGYYFLINRNQFDFEKFLYDEKHNMLYILNLTPNKKILGLQTRQLGFIKNNDPKYKTYTLTNIYKLLLGVNMEISSEIDKLSMLFNICNIDINKPIIVLEGPLDAFLIKNAIATTGANKHLNLNLLFYYLYDDDNTGKTNAINKLNEGYYVFLWNKFKLDYNLPNRKKWDWNDVINYFKSMNFSIKPNIYLYFSNSSYDILDI